MPFSTAAYKFNMDKRSNNAFLNKHRDLSVVEKDTFETFVMKSLPLIRKFDVTTVNVEIVSNHWLAFFNQIDLDDELFKKEVQDEIMAFGFSLAKTPPLDLFASSMIDLDEGILEHNCFTAAWHAATTLHGHAWNLTTKEIAKKEDQADLEQCLTLLLPTSFDSQKLKAALATSHLVLGRELAAIKWHPLFSESFTDTIDAFNVRHVKLPGKKGGKIEGLPSFPKPGTESDDNYFLRCVLQDQTYGKSKKKKAKSKISSRTNKNKGVMETNAFAKFRLQNPKLPGWSTFQIYIQRAREILVVLRLRYPEDTEEVLDQKLDQLFDDCQFLPDTNTVIHNLIKEMKGEVAARDMKEKAAKVAEAKASKAQKKQLDLEETEAALEDAKTKDSTLDENDRQSRVQKNLIKNLEKSLKKAKEDAKKASESSAAAAVVAAEDPIVEDPKTKKRKKAEDADASPQPDPLTDDQKAKLNAPPKRDRKYRHSIRYLLPGPDWSAESSAKLWAITSFMNFVEEETEKHPDSIKLDDAAYINLRDQYVEKVKREIFNATFVAPATTTPVEQASTAAGVGNHGDNANGVAPVDFESFNETISMIPDYYLSDDARAAIIQAGFLGPTKKGLTNVDVEESLATWMHREAWRDFFYKMHCLGNASKLAHNQELKLRKVAKRFAKKEDKDRINAILDMFLVK